MQRRLYLHIGSEKTGSTSIQKFLRLNSGLLQKNNIITFKRQINVPMLFGDKESFEEIVPPFCFTHQRALLSRLLTRTLKSSSYTTAVISSELFHSRIKTSFQVKAIFDFFSPYFDEIVPLYYYRDPLSKMRSLFFESLKSCGCSNVINRGHILSSAVMNPYVYHSCSTKLLPSKWETYFPKLIAMNYDLSCASPHGVIDSLLNEIPPLAALSNKLTFPKRFYNKSLSKSDVAALLYINSLVSPSLSNSHSRYFVAFMCRRIYPLVSPVLPVSLVDTLSKKIDLYLDEVSESWLAGYDAWCKNSLEITYS